MTSTRERKAEIVPRRRWAWRAAKWGGLGLAAVVVAIAAYWTLASSGAVPAPPSVTVPTPAASEPVVIAPQPTPVEGSGTGADGCLGGPDPYAAILPAQASAALDHEGAAAFALSYIRWDRYPVDPNLPAVLPLVTTPGFHEQSAARIARLTEGAATAAAAGEETAFEVGLAPGVPAQYRVVGGDPAGESVSLNVAFTREYRAPDGRSAQESLVTTVIVDAVDGHWVVAAVEAPVLADPAAPIAGAPWVSYAGVC